SLLPNSRPAGAVDTSEIVSVTVRVRAGGSADALAKKKSELASQPLADRKYLTREELAALQGARHEELDKVEQFAQQHDLVVVHRSAAERSIVLKGRFGDILAAFPADVHIYHHARGTYRGRKGEIKIPAELDGIITGVFGLDSRPKHRSPHR